MKNNGKNKRVKQSLSMLILSVFTLTGVFGPTASLMADEAGSLFTSTPWDGSSTLSSVDNSWTHMEIGTTLEEWRAVEAARKAEEQHRASVLRKKKEMESAPLILEVPEDGTDPVFTDEPEGILEDPVLDGEVLQLDPVVENGEFDETASVGILDDTLEIYPGDGFVDSEEVTDEYTDYDEIETEVVDDEAEAEEVYDEESEAEEDYDDEAEDEEICDEEAEDEEICDEEAEDEEIYDEEAEDEEIYDEEAEDEEIYDDEAEDEEIYDEEAEDEEVYDEEAEDEEVYDEEAEDEEVYDEEAEDEEVYDEEAEDEEIYDEEAEDEEVYDEDGYGEVVAASAGETTTALSPDWGVETIAPLLAATTSYIDFSFLEGNDGSGSTKGDALFSSAALPAAGSAAGAADTNETADFGSIPADGSAFEEETGTGAVGAAEGNSFGSISMEDADPDASAAVHSMEIDESGIFVEGDELLGETSANTGAAEDGIEAGEMTDGEIGYCNLSVTMNLLFDQSDADVPVFAEGQNYFAAVFSDPELTMMVSDVGTFYFADSDTCTVTFYDLIAGQTYYLAEVDINGNPISSDGYVSPYYATQGYGSMEIAPIAEGDTRNEILDNMYTSLPDSGFYFQGSLAVTKNLEGTDGSDEVFYAGIYTDAGHTVMADNVSSNLLDLPMNGGTSTTVYVDVFLHGANPQDAAQTFYIAETDDMGDPVSDSFEQNGVTYTSSVSGGGAAEVTVYDGAGVVITNTASGGGETSSHRVNVTKNLVRSDGQTVTSEEVQFFSANVALFTDQGLTQMVEGAQVTMEFQVGGSTSTAYFDGLPDGVYYLAEVDGIGIPVSGDGYTPSYAQNGGTSLEITLDGADANVEFSNVFPAPNVNTYEGQITISKKVQTSTGVEARSNGTFYAGIFTDPEFQNLAPAGTDAGAVVSQNVVQLAMNGTTTGTGTVTVTLTGASEAEAQRVLYIAETNSEGAPVDQAGFTQGGITYSVSVDSPQVTVTTTSYPQVTIINTAVSTGQNTTVTPTPTAAASASITPAAVGHTTGGNGSVQPVSTADNTPIGLYVMLLAVAALAAVWVGISRSRKEKD